MITAQNIRDMFEGVDDFTRGVLVRTLKDELIAAITAVNETHPRVLSPRPDLIMNFARQCSFANARVCIIGQDPYLNNATGLCFSQPFGVPLSPSLRNIFACLGNMPGNPQMGDLPRHSDLTAWARQGVVLLNSALTTTDRAGAHTAQWAAYTGAVIRELSRLRRMVFILLGNHAIEKQVHIEGEHDIFTWGHPSPLNAANQRPGPANFINCDVFAKTNAVLDRPIDWRNDLYARVNELYYDDRTYVFTDGGASANGRASAEARWGVYLNAGPLCARLAGPVEHVELGQKYTTSNNRAELTAILRGLEFVRANIALLPGSVIIVSDSKYSIQAVTEWIHSWRAGGLTDERKNIDLIDAAEAALSDLRKYVPVTFRHQRGHKTKPSGDEAIFMWDGNRIADELCSMDKKIRTRNCA